MTMIIITVVAAIHSLGHTLNPGSICGWSTVDVGRRLGDDGW